MSFTVAFTSPSSSSSSHHYHRKHQSFPLPTKSTLHFHSLSFPRFLLRASSSSSSSRRIDGLSGGPGNWSRSINSKILNYDDDEEEEEGEEEDRNLDLLVRFVENVFKKLSRRARKAVRSILPSSISTKLVGFSVNGVLVLALLWIVKAFLEVVCTLGSITFASILLIRMTWSAVAYLQDSRSSEMNVLDGDRQAWTGTQPAT